MDRTYLNTDRACQELRRGGMVMLRLANGAACILQAAELTGDGHREHLQRVAGSAPPSRARLSPWHPEQTPPGYSTAHRERVDRGRATALPERKQVPCAIIRCCDPTGGC